MNPYKDECHCCGAPLAPSGDCSLSCYRDPDAQLFGISIGSKAGEYVIRHLLRRGPSSFTYYGECCADNRPVAIKEYFPQGRASRDLTTVVPLSDFADDFKKGLEAFDREATLHSSVNHTAVVRVVDFSHSYNTAYLVTEYRPGWTFHAFAGRFKRRQIPESVALELTFRILPGLGAVHDAGLIHKDIKPTNVYLVRNAENTYSPVLLDFGASQRVSETGHTSTVTTGFSPIEQYSLRASQGPWTDIYSLAATVYCGVTGVPPPASPDRVLIDTLIHPRDLNPELSDRFSSAIWLALSVDPEDRPQTIGDFSRLLSM